MRLKAFATAFLFLLVPMLSGCDDDPEPKKEAVTEMITKVTLTFRPLGLGLPVIATATDPDGEGVQDLIVDGPIELTPGTSYSLTIELFNELADPNDPAYNITQEVLEEADEHMFFFSWTNDIFSEPVGNGNIDNRSDAVAYEDEDPNGLPLGLVTSWTTVEESKSGSFRILLKHQPELKNETSTSSVGETDLDITFTVNIL